MHTTTRTLVLYSDCETKQKGGPPHHEQEHCIGVVKKMGGWGGTPLIMNKNTVLFCIFAGDESQMRGEHDPSITSDLSRNPQSSQNF